MQATRKQIFTLAWKLFKGGIFQNFADALRAAWKQATQGFNLVSFIKKSTGKITERRIALLSRFYTPKGTSDRKPTSTLKFVDLQKIEAGEKFFIISFNPEQVISFS